MVEYTLSFIISLIYALTIFVIVWLVMALCIAVYARKPRRALNWITPFFVALDPVINRFNLLLPIAIVIVLVGGSNLLDGSSPWPPPGSHERLWGERIFGLWFMMFFGGVLRAAGFPPAMPTDTRIRVVWVFQWIALILGIALMTWPGNYAVGVLLTVALYIAMVGNFSKRLAQNAFWSAEKAEETESTETISSTIINDIVFVHLTDLHITASDKPRVESEESGNDRLKTFLKEIPKQGVAWLLITGDLTDHGTEEEWEHIAENFENIKKINSAIRIIIAPGNHDLGTAYNTIDAYFSLYMAQKKRRPFPISDGTYLLRYLKYAAIIEPGIMTASGSLLADVIKANQDAEHEILAAWKLLQGTSTPNPAGNAALADRAHELYHDIPREAWDDVIRRKSLNSFEEAVRPQIWRKRWFDYFPLYLLDKERNEATVIINSNAPDPTLGGGAWGQIGKEQLGRFDKLCEKLSSYRVYLLCHHAPVRWDDLPPSGFKEVKKWATTSMIAEDINHFLCSLKKLQQVIFLCGHRHGGKSKKIMVGTWEAGIIMEGASFADPATELGAGWLNPNNKLQVGLLSGNK